MLMFSFYSESNSKYWFIESQKELGNEAGFQCNKSVAEIVDFS